jgi:hypothetical protein
LSKMAFDLARLRLALLRKLGWRGLFSLRQQRALLKDVRRGLFLMPFYGSKLRENLLIRAMFRSRETGPTGEESGSDALLSRNIGG